MPTVDANGITLYYETHGTGPEVVLIHGFGDSAALWQAQVDGLQDRYRLTTLDMRGHARSGAPSDVGLYTQDQIVEDVRAVMDAAGVARAVVGGHSLGGYTSLRFYQRYPDRVRGLILSGTGPGYRRMDGARQWTEMNARDSAALAERGLDTTIDAREAEIGRHGGTATIKHTTRGLVFVRQGVMRMPPLVECSEIAVATLVLVGEKDAPFRNSSEYMAAKIPHARGPIVVAGASHWCNYDDPATWNTSASEFLAALPG